MTIHKHHIVPRHMGGTDHPDNIVELTIEEHADAHSLLYALYKNPFDKIAELSLLNMIDKSEAIRMVQSERGKMGAAYTNKLRRGKPVSEKKLASLCHDWVVERRDGKIYKVSNLTRFCAEHGLNKAGLKSAYQQDRWYRKTWFLYKGELTW